MAETITLLTISDSFVSAREIQRINDGNFNGKVHMKSFVTKENGQRFKRYYSKRLEKKLICFIYRKSRLSKIFLSAR